MRTVSPIDPQCIDEFPSDQISDSQAQPSETQAYQGSAGVVRGELLESVTEARGWESVTSAPGGCAPWWL